MYTLLLVDDETEILNFLGEICAEINQYDLQIFKASSGAAALEVMRKTRIDVIISDIRMPGMDGIELMNIVQKETPKCKFILLTGYRSFDSIYQAVRQGGIRYLLKTETDEKIRQTVLEAIAELENGLLSASTLEKAKKYMQRLIPSLQTQFIEGLINGTEELPVTQARLDEVSFPITTDDPFRIFLCQLDCQSAERIKQAQNRSVAAEILHNCLPATLKYASYPVGNFILWLVWQTASAADDPDSSRRKVRNALEYAQSIYRKTTASGISFALSSYLLTIASLADAFFQLKRLLVRRVRLDVEIMTEDKQHPLQKNNHSDTNGRDISFTKLSAAQIQLLREHMEHGRKASYFKLFSLFKITEDSAYPLFLEIYYSLAAMLLGYINRFHLLEGHQKKFTIQKLMQAESHSSLQAAIAYLASVADIIFEAMEHRTSSRTRQVIDRVTKYVDSHLGEELSLVKLSGVVHFNASYLSRLFKQETGENISEYILRKRMECAKQQLCTTNRKIGDISKSVGYQSAHSFSRLFRSIHGVPPQDYRLQNGENP